MQEEDRPGGGQSVPPERDGRKPLAGPEKDERTLRREQALRANLRRRKAQTRARSDAGASDKDSEKPE